MASGLEKYMMADPEMDPAQISMDDLQALQNPMGVISVPETLKEQDLAQLYDQKMREASLKQQESVDALQNYIHDYSAQPRGIDWTAAAAFFQNPQLMQAAQGMKPVSEEQKAQNIMELQAKLADKMNAVSQGNIQALSNQLKAKEAANKQAQLEAQRKEQNRLEMERQSALEKYREKQLALQERIAQMQGQGRADARQAGIDQKNEARFDKDVQALEKRVGDIAPGIAKKLENLDQLIPGGIEGDIQEEVPGAGVGKFMIPDWAMNNESSEVQQNARGLAADLIKLQSGTAASDKEVDRKLKELGMAPGSKSSTFRSGLKRLKGQFVQEMKNKEAGFDPKVKETYQSRGGLTHEKILSIGQKPQASEVDAKMKRLQELKAKAGIP